MFSMFRRQQPPTRAVDDWAIQAGWYLGNAFYHVEKVSTTLERRRVGPHIVLFDFMPNPPSHANRQKLLRSAPLVRSTLPGISRVAIYEEDGFVVVRVRLPDHLVQPLDPLAFEGSSGVVVPIGIRDDGAVDVLDLDHSPHVLIVGPSNMGKTTIGRGIVFHLARQNLAEELRLVVTGADASDWQGVAHLPHSWGFVYHAQAARVVDWLMNEMRRRQSAGVRTPRIVVFVDDAAALLTDAPEVGKLLGTLTSQARHAGIHFILLSQQATVQATGASLVLSNTARRFVVGASSAQDAARMAGRADTNAHELVVGEALTVGGVDGVSIVAVPNITPEMLVGLGSGVREAAPWEFGSLAAPPSMAASTRSGFEAAPDALKMGQNEAILDPASAPSNPLRPTSAASSLDEKDRDVLRRVKAGMGFKAAIVEVYEVEGGTTYQKIAKRITEKIANFLPEDL